MSDYEKQVVTLIKFKASDHVDRQDYLASLIRAADKWLQKNDENGDIFDGWDNELASWFDEAVHAMNAKRKIPDFPDIELGEEESVPDDETDEVDSEEDDETEDEEAEEEADDEPEPTRKDEVSDEIDPVETKPVVSKPPKSGRRKAKSKHNEFNNVTNDAVQEATRDRYGVLMPTKTHDAVLMYERGCTQREITETIGGKHYNVLKQLAKRGHRVDKLPGNVIKLTHKDDLE